RGRFRRELFLHLNANAVSVPPLRERSEDVRALVERFIDEFNQRSMRPIVEGAAPDVCDLLERHDFPGNLRELEALVSAACAKCRGKQLRLDHLPVELVARCRPAGRSTGVAEAGDTVEALERAYLLRVLDANECHLSAVAKRLGLSRAKLSRKRKRLAI